MGLVILNFIAIPVGFIRIGIRFKKFPRTEEGDRKRSKVFVLLIIYILSTVILIPSFGLAFAGHGGEGFFIDLMSVIFQFYWLICILLVVLAKGIAN